MFVSGMLNTANKYPKSMTKARVQMLVEGKICLGHNIKTKILLEIFEQDNKMACWDLFFDTT
jgi:hypothetical protein